jgi:hypothetical protein
LSGFASDFEAASEFLTHAATESFIQGFFADSIGPTRHCEPTAAAAELFAHRSALACRARRRWANGSVEARRA